MSQKGMTLSFQTPTIIVSLILKNQSVINSEIFHIYHQQQMEQQQPLLSGEKGSSKYEYVGRGSVIPTASLSGGEGVSVDEIRAASATAPPSHHFYPPALHAPLISHEYPPSPPQGQGIPYQGAYYGEQRGNVDDEQRQALDEVEIRELLIDHVGHRCCWGSRPARTWKIHAIEDCNVYVGTLETFIEERELVIEKEPYLGGNTDGKAKGPELGIWELDLRSEFPVLFSPYKESRLRVPQSEVIEKCEVCEGNGRVVCPTCKAENLMTECSSCYGRGLVAHRDGSDSICKKCDSKGKIPCSICFASGTVICETCEGASSLVMRKVAVIKWKTLSTRKVSTTPGAASVPDDVFHRAKGVQLCNTQAYQCAPAFFADSYFLNKFSSEVIAERAHVPATARVICERHAISVVPVTRVTMTHRRSSFSFYIIGYSREVYLKEYYPSTFCWGLCPCLEWLKL